MGGGLFGYKPDVKAPVFAVSICPNFAAPVIDTEPPKAALLVVADRLPLAGDALWLAPSAKREKKKYCVLGVKAVLYPIIPPVPNTVAAAVAVTQVTPVGMFAMLIAYCCPITVLMVMLVAVFDASVGGFGAV